MGLIFFVVLYPFHWFVTICQKTARCHLYILNRQRATMGDLKPAGHTADHNGSSYKTAMYTYSTACTSIYVQCMHVVAPGHTNSVCSCMQPDGHVKVINWQMNGSFVQTHNSYVVINMYTNTDQYIISLKESQIALCTEMLAPLHLYSRSP